MGSVHESLCADKREPGSSALVVCPSLPADETIRCVDALRSSRSRTEPTVVVSRAHTAQALLENWQSTIGSFPERLGIVSIGEVTRSVSAASTAVTLPQAYVQTIGTEDVTGIGIAIGEAFLRWEDDTNPLLWFDSLTPLIEGKGLEMTFRFLHVTLEEVRQAGAVAYVHIDSEKHDEQTIRTLGHLFDDVLEYDTESVTLNE
ncbi:hypothetical protein ACLI4R_01015 [Natrialbaceae archaeon A-chndr2]